MLKMLDKKKFGFCEIDFTGLKSVWLYRGGTRHRPAKRGGAGGRDPLAIAPEFLQVLDFQRIDLLFNIIAIMRHALIYKAFLVSSLKSGTTSPWSMAGAI